MRRRQNRLGRSRKQGITPEARTVAHDTDGEDHQRQDGRRFRSSGTRVRARTAHCLRRGPGGRRKGRWHLKGSRKNYLAFCCWPPGPLARRERRAIPEVVCEKRATKPAGLRAGSLHRALHPRRLSGCPSGARIKTHRVRMLANAGAGCVFLADWRSHGLECCIKVGPQSPSEFGAGSLSTAALPFSGVTSWNSESI